jgi:tetratricopeptide (TPR) repeat protein
LRTRKSAAPAGLLAAVLTSGGIAAHALEPAGPSIDDKGSAKEFAAAIESLNARDPQSPDTLSTRLAYADFLAQLDPGDCVARLDAARDQLDVAKASPALMVVLTAGPARLASVEYQYHLARAFCAGSAEGRDQELHAALACAQRAVEHYRDAFDAVSMVAMQFNTSVVYHNLGDTEAATAALQTTIDLDREYGFADDAAENYRLLLQWSHEQAGPVEIAARMQDFPQRSVTLTFGWFESDANVTFQTDVTQLAGHETVHLRGSRTAQRQVRKRSESWRVSYLGNAAHYELGELPTDESLMSQFANSLALMLVQFHDFGLARNGDFGEGSNDLRFELRVRADSKPLVRDLDSRGLDSRGAHSARLAHLFSSAVRIAQASEAIEAQVAEDYNLEAGTWIGATLEQGVWYDMTAALSLPLAPQALLMHRIQFTYSRPLACLPDSTDVSCIEIVLRATPDPAILNASLDRLAQRSRLAPGQAPQLWSATTMRLVTDPRTLQTYRLETQRHAYWWSGESGPDHSLSESEKTVLFTGPISRAQ